MKISIVNNGTIAEVLVGESPPSLEAVNNKLLLYENFKYRLIVSNANDWKNVELFIGDYPIPLHYNANADCYETGEDLIFEGCFDLTYICLYIDDDYGKERLLFTEFLRVATKKQTAKRIERMLGEIEENLPNFLDVCFSKNEKKSGLVKKNVKSIWNTLKIVDEVIDIYEKFYGYFNNHKRTVVEPVTAIVDARSMQMINQESLRWIVSNPDNLVLTNKNTGIVIKDKNYMPMKVKTHIPHYSYDVYENKVILGFLENVIGYLDNQILGFNKEIMGLKNIPDTIVAQLPNTHELTGKCVYVYYTGIIKRFSDKRDMLQEIFYKYEKILECLPLSVYAPPKLTNTFRQVYHYRICYECMVKWFEEGDYTFNHLNYLFKLKTLSRIFEYFCLIKIQNAITKCGYMLQETKRIIYDEEDNTEEINNLYVFSGNDYKVTLLYEPSIWNKKVNEETNLYSTGFNFVKGRRNEGWTPKGKWKEGWTPDFIIKISCDNRSYYYILDAKYSSETNVKKIYMPELVLKYGAQIASKDKSFSEVVAIGAFYPEEKDKIFFFKKNSVNSSKISLPQYFSLTVVGEKVGDIFLRDRLKELLKIVDDLEIEREESGTHRPVIEEIQRDAVLQKNAKEENPKVVEKEIVNLEAENLSKNETNEYQSGVITRVNGKKCFYYGKSLCLYKKARCDAGEKGCEKFIPKNSKKLLSKEDTCRSFICYTKRGKVSRGTCSVSGLPGCVGPENCKFYMKKRKS